MGHTHSIRAAIAALRGDDNRAVGLLDQATTVYLANDMFSYAAAVRRRQGEVQGGEEGRALVDESNAWMASRGIKNPTRMTAMYAPGFPD